MPHIPENHTLSHVNPFSIGRKCMAGNGAREAAVPRQRDKNALQPPAPKPASPKLSTPLSTPPRLRHPPSVEESLSGTGLLFPPLEARTRLLPYLCSTLILPARVSSTNFAQTTILHIRSSVLLLYSTTGTFQAVLQLPPQSLTTVNETVTIAAISRNPLFIRPAPGSTGPLLRALRPPVPPPVTLLRKLSNRVFTGRWRGGKVAVKLFDQRDLPEYAIPTRAVLQRAWGVGVTPLLAAIQGRGYCGLVMPIMPDLASYIQRFGKLDVVQSRGVLAHLVNGICRVHGIGGVTGEFGKEHVLLTSGGAMISRVAHVEAVYDREKDGPRGRWEDCLISLTAVIRECCEIGEMGEHFVKGCQSGWSAATMQAHEWVRGAGTPRLRRMRVKGSKDIGVVRRIGSGGPDGIFGWEFVHR